MSGDSTKVIIKLNSDKVYNQPAQTTNTNTGQTNLDKEIRKELSGGQGITEMFKEISKHFEKDTNTTSKSSGFFTITDMEEGPDGKIILTTKKTKFPTEEDLAEEPILDTKRRAPKLDYKNFSLPPNGNFLQQNKTPLEKLYIQSLISKNPENPPSMPQ